MTYSENLSRTHKTIINKYEWKAVKYSRGLIIITFPRLLLTSSVKSFIWYLFLLRVNLVLPKFPVWTVLWKYKDSDYQRQYKKLRQKHQSQDKQQYSKWTSKIPEFPRRNIGRTFALYGSNSGRGKLWRSYSARWYKWYY